MFEIESELAEVTKHKKETKELLQDKEKEVITQRMQLSEATKKKVMIMQYLTFYIILMKKIFFFVDCCTEKIKLSQNKTG